MSKFLNNIPFMTKNQVPKKIIFVIPSLAGGGAERVIMNILTHLDKNKYDIYLALCEKRGPYLKSIPSYVKIYDLKKTNTIDIFKAIFSLCSIFRKEKPDIVVSFIDYTNMISIIAKLLSFKSFRLIISSRTTLTKDLPRQRHNKIKTFLYNVLFNFANFIVVNSIGSKKGLLFYINVNVAKIKVIYNPLDLETIDNLKKEPLEKMGFDKYILAVGRLIEPKGFSYLLMAYSLISEKINEKIVILGVGEYEERLKKLAKDLGIQEKVIFLGFQRNPYKFMKNASIFVVSSLWEGFPNVLIEAMACGVPVISTDCNSGPSEVIVNGENGILVPTANEKALAGAMLNLLMDENLRRKFSETGRKRAEDFRMEKILPLYEELFL